MRVRGAGRGYWRSGKCATGSGTVITAPECAREVPETCALHLEHGEDSDDSGACDGDRE